MKAMDRDGLLLCELQAEAFELSTEKTQTGSAVFVRRFMNSEAAKWLDSGAALASAIRPEDLLAGVEEQYGPSAYGSQKYTRGEMHWMGYLYRYYAYTYERSSASAYRLMKPKELRGLFLPYHTLDPAQALERILEAKGIPATAQAEFARQYEIYRRIRRF